MSTIILNKEAVETLFPEGSEARVKLQRSVLEQLVKQYIKAPAIATDVLTQLEKAKADLRTEMMASLSLESRGRFGPVVLNAAMRERVQTEVLDSLQAQINRSVTEVKIDIEGMVNREIASHLSITVRKALAEAMKANTVLQSLSAIATGGSS